MDLNYYTYKYKNICQTNYLKLLNVVLNYVQTVLERVVVNTYLNYIIKEKLFKNIF